MYDNPFTKEDLIEALTDKDMDVFESNFILGYYGFTIQEIITIRQALDGRLDKMQMEQIKKKIKRISQNAGIPQERIKECITFTQKPTC